MSTHFHFGVGIIVAGARIGFPPDEHEPPSYATFDDAQLAASRATDELVREQLRQGRRRVTRETLPDGYEIGWFDGHGDRRGRYIQVVPCTATHERTRVA